MSTTIRVDISPDGARTVEVHWDDGAEPDLSDMLNVLEALGVTGLVAPQTQTEGLQGRDIPIVARAVPGPGPKCRRMLCGHDHADHCGRDDAGQLVVDDLGHGGMCTVCNNADSCRSFVGSEL